MKRYITPAIAALSFTLMSNLAALAEDAMVKVGSLEVSSAWARATLPNQPAASGYMTIENKGTEPDHLVSVTSPSSPATEVHNMEMENDVMKMTELLDGLEIPAGGKVELKPGGSHIMFMDLKTGFKEGETVKLTLKFEKAGEVEIDLPVQPADAKELPHAHGG